MTYRLQSSLMNPLELKSKRKPRLQTVKRLLQSHFLLRTKVLQTRLRHKKLIISPNQKNLTLTQPQKSKQHSMRSLWPRATSVKERKHSNERLPRPRTRQSSPMTMMMTTLRCRIQRPRLPPQLRKRRNSRACSTRSIPTLKSLIDTLMTLMTMIFNLLTNKLSKLKHDQKCY